MDTYITGQTIKNLREKKGFTQTELAEKIGVCSKAVSKWETAKGLPDITLIEPIANALSVSVMELMTGNAVVNKNISSNILRSKFYVCPLCGNIIRTMGDTVVSCCGIILPPLEAEETDNEHNISIEKRGCKPPNLIVRFLYSPFLFDNCFFESYNKHGD